jgi:capsular polysaccharide transport system permease protein
LDEEVARPLEAPTGSTDIDKSRKEGLTGRQLRMARRTAQRHDLPATSDFDAVRLLRQAGIEPFQRSNLLELAPKSHGSARPPAKPGRASRPQLPQRRGASENLPALIEGEDPALRRAREVERIQQSIIRRRQKNWLCWACAWHFLSACRHFSQAGISIRSPHRCIRQNLPF